MEVVGATVALEPFKRRLLQIAVECEQLSKEHRLPYSGPGVYDRMRGLLQDARPLFQEWTIEICLLLDHGQMRRFNQLLAELAGISSRTLAAKLAQLQDFGFVDRAFFDENPPRVEYRLTPAGHRFIALLFPTVVHVAESHGSMIG